MTCGLIVFSGQFSIYIYSLSQPLVRILPHVSVTSPHPSVCAPIVTTAGPQVTAPHHASLKSPNHFPVPASVYPQYNPSVRGGVLHRLQGSGSDPANKFLNVAPLDTTWPTPRLLLWTVGGELGRSPPSSTPPRAGVERVLADRATPSPPSTVTAQSQQLLQIRATRRHASVCLGCP